VSSYIQDGTIFSPKPTLSATTYNVTDRRTGRRQYDASSQ